MSEAVTYDVHVVTHTHWDREWYHPAGRFRQRLVALIDELLAESAEGDCFLLDGQAVVLEDYLAVRPDRAAELSRRLAAGALEAGPWYVLADELIPSGEALVRNLLAGRRVLRALRAEPPPVLYCPDSFGHPAALPVLARGFECPVVVLWRGLGARQARQDTLRWSAADGTEALVYHLPRSGYEFGSALPADEAGARQRWRAIEAELAPRARLGVMLVQNGADHHARQLDHARAITALERAAAPHRVHQSSLAGFAAEVHRRAHAVAMGEGERLPRIAGELRDSYGFTWALQGTFATRAAQKRRNAAVERLLTREAEPWAALARRRGDASRRQLVDAAWRTLLLCHPHDTLCGCSIDEVARAMDARLDDAAAQGAGIRDDALRALAGHDPVAARGRRAEWRPVVHVRNAAARARRGIAELEVLTFVRDVPVGPGSAPRAGAAEARALEPATIALGDGRIPVQVLERAWRHHRLESPRHYPDNDLVEVARVLAWLPPVPAYGTMGLPLAPRRRAPAELPHTVTAEKSALDNGVLRLTIDRRGVRVESRDHGEAPLLLGFEDVGDRGDLYTHSPVGERRSAKMVRARVTRRGPLRGEIETRWRLSLPPGLPPEGKRPGRAIAMELTARLTIDAGDPFVRVDVRGENRARDHRLRLLIGTGLAGARVYADAAFGPVAREPLSVPAADLATETPPPTAPMHRYVSLFTGDRGATVYGDGLAEYEAMADGTVALTLMRAVGELSRNDLPERPGHAGWPVPTPEAQSIGPFDATFALMLHGPRTRATIDAIERAADDVLLPLTGQTIRDALALPEPVRGLELQGEGLAFSAAKESESGDWLVLRCVNLAETEVLGRWCLGVPLSEARLARLDETPLDPISIDPDGVSFVAPPRAVVTLLVR